MYYTPTWRKGILTRFADSTVKKPYQIALHFSTFASGMHIGTSTNVLHIPSILNSQEIPHQPPLMRVESWLKPISIYLHLYITRFPQSLVCMYLLHEGD